jgi:phosphoserine phosphatase
MVGTEEIVERLARARETAKDRGRQGIVVFDADGTLWEGDIGNQTFEAVLAKRAARRAALPALRNEAALIGAPLREDPNEQASVLYDAFLSGALPDLRAYSMMAWIFAGYTPAEVRAFASGVIEAVGLAGRVFPEVLPILRWAREARVPLWIVSASPLYVVEEAVRKLELPVDRVYGMTPWLEQDIVAPRLLEPAPYRTGKVDLLVKEASAVSILGAFGDSAADLPMLALGEVKVAVGPQPALVASAHGLSDLVELALGGTRGRGL